MSLGRKLARFADAGPGSAAAVAAAADSAAAAAADPAAASATDRLAWLRASLDRLMTAQAKRPPPRMAAPPTPSGAPGERRATPAGDVQVVEHRLDPMQRHGHALVAAALEATAAEIAALALDARLVEVEVPRLLYVDTETTGLSGGTGTLAFLIGLGWFEDRVFCVEQLLLRQPGEEAPMLAALAERLRAASAIVSYNGKSFDWPLLKSRFVMNRLAPPPEPLHLDLLHCARRVFKRRTPSLRLGAVESEVLGFSRVDDIEGALIPQRYFDYLRGAPGDSLCPILEHNRLDLVALAALLGDLSARLCDRAPRDDARDRLSFAELLLRGKDVERALAFARAAAARGREDRLTVEALALAARLHKRRREHALSADCLREALALAHEDRALAPPLHLALAKLLEHQLPAPAEALAHAELAAAAEDADTHRRRVERLAAAAAAAAVTPAGVAG